MEEKRRYCKVPHVCEQLTSFKRPRYNEKHAAAVASTRPLKGSSSISGGKSKVMDDVVTVLKKGTLDHIPLSSL